MCVCVFVSCAMCLRMKKEPDSNYARMLQAILNKSQKHHPTKQQLVLGMILFTSI